MFIDIKSALGKLTEPKQTTKPMKVLIGCECSGTVRDAFLARGHDAWSCDIKPDESGSNRHIRDDVRTVLKYEQWDFLAVLHPPCTRLTNSGVRWLSQPPGGIYTDNHTQAEVDAYADMTEQERHAFMWHKLDEGAALFSDCLNADVPRVVVENPVMHRHAKERIRNFKPAAQFVQPHAFGDPFFKATGLWLRGLPKLEKTNQLVLPKKGTDEYKAWSAIHYASPGPNRATERSRFFPGMADAMAEQWGDYAAA